MARRTFVSALVAAGLVSFAADADAQTLRFSTTAPGGIASTGNTLGLAKGFDENGPGTAHSIGTFISLDPSSLDTSSDPSNPWPFGTTSDWSQNGSAAMLTIPPGAEVLHAELVWAGSYDYFPEDVYQWLDFPVSMLADSAEIFVDPDASSAQTLSYFSPVGFYANYYLRSADVTSFVQAHGTTMYAVAGVPGTQGDLTNSLSAAGWSLVVAYRDDTSPIRNLTVFVGGSFVDEDATVDYTVDGFCAPPYGAVEGKATIAALEGDANLTGEDFAIGETSASVMQSLFGPNNPENNFFASQINDGDGQLDVNGTFGTANHDALNGVNVAGARQGWDHTTVAVSSTQGHVANDQTSAVLRTSTNGDSYFPVLVALELDVKAPDFSDSMTQASLQAVQIGDSFTVTTTLANSGEAQATDLILALPIDGGLVLTGFTMDTEAGDAQGNPVTAMALDMGIDSGVLHVSELRTIQLEVEVVGPPDNGSEYVFSPHWAHSFTSCSTDPAIDEAFAGPSASVQYIEDGGEPMDPQTPPTDPLPDDDGIADDPAVEGACGCEVPGNDSGSGTGSLALLALGAAMALRRRRS
jgi:MYXO-CTERM domain-containing protein/uncharacterized repeat protein (TIGR01451 family)